MLKLDWAGKVTIYFSWANACHDSLGQDKPVVMINMDETSIAGAYPSKLGTVVSSPRWEGVNTHALAEPFGISDTHFHITYCAFVCSNTEMQPELPQILVVNHKKWTTRMSDYADATLPDNVMVWTERSAWVTQALFLEILVALCDRLRPHQARFHFVLVVDASRSHISSRIASCARANGITMLIVPGKLTWMLQPLDVHFFANFKNLLVSKLNAARARSPHGVLQPEVWLRQVFDCIVWLQQQDASIEFDRNGLCGNQNNLRLVTKQHLFSADLVAAIGRQLPTAEQLAFLLGVKNVPYHEALTTTLAARASGEYVRRPRITFGVPIRRG